MQVTPVKKKVLIISILALFFIAAIVLSTIFMSKELDLYIPVSSEDYDDVSLEFTDDQLVELVFLRKEGPELYHARVKAADNHITGSTDASLLCLRPGFVRPDIYGLSVHVTSLGILYSGAYSFNGMHLVFFLMGLMFLTFSVLLFKWHREYRKSRFFSYGSILDLGLSIYFLAQAVIYFITVAYSLTRIEPLKGENLITINSFALSLISILTFPVILIFSILITLSNLVLIKKEGRSPTNALGILLSILLIAGLVVIAFLMITSPSMMMTLDLKNSALVVVRGIISSLFFYFVCNLFSTLLLCQLAGLHKPSYDKDYVLILGCGIRDDGTLYPLLQGRADRAVAFYHKQAEATGTPPCLVPSGGQGPDECMPEGEAIRNYLISQGIPEDHILPETRSVNTLENMKFSKEIIEKKVKSSDSDDTEISNVNVAFSTTNFHVFRSGILAYDAGMNADGMGAKTKWYFWPNALIREFIGMLARHWKLHATILILIITQAVLSGNAQWAFGIL